MSMKRKRVWLSVLAVATAVGAAAGVAAAQDEAVSLRPQWREGQTSRYEVWSERTQRRSVEVAGQQQEAERSIGSRGEVTWTVQQVHGDGSATCEMTFDWLSMTLRGREGEQVNDSRQGSGDTPPVHEMLRALAGTPLEVRVAPDGTIQSIAGSDAIRQQLDSPQAAPRDLTLVDNASNLATLIAGPANARPGDQWQASHRWQHEMGLITERTRWRLEGVEVIAGIPIATVVAEGDLELEVDESDIPPEAPPIDVDLREGSVRSQVMFDLQRGEVVGRNSVRHTLVEVTVRGPQQTMRQQMAETSQGQALRIAEE